MDFIPSYPPVHFGQGSLIHLNEWLTRKSLRNPLVISDRGLFDAGVVDAVLEALSLEFRASTFCGISENPTFGCVEGALEVYRENNCDSIVGLGGGSVLDAGKALRIIVNHDRPLLEYLQNPSLITVNVAPYATVPTTAGTGAEVTFGGGIHPVANAPPLGLRSVHLQPDIAFCDPNLTISLPPGLTAATGMDALVHCIEGYLSTNTNLPAEAIALDGIARASQHVQRAVADGNDLVARTNMLMAALEGGMAIYMGLGPVHALSMAFGDSPLHHGTLVTVCTPPVMKEFDGISGDKLNRIASAMKLAVGGPVGQRIAEEIGRMNNDMGLPSSVGEMGYSGGPLENVVEAAYSNWFNDTSPKKFTKNDYENIISELLS
ncbi:MAG: iron-containing alcohol dehydrogenase [Pseudomonadota bacterium]|nr:iron-containing alcohol dehydrogenase [Pseudomonadota bacterium]